MWFPPELQHRVQEQMPNGKLVKKAGHWLSPVEPFEVPLQDRSLPQEKTFGKKKAKHGHGAPLQEFRQM
ncbi:MAG: hypothetical protein K0S38_544 [Candidatus Paceibacter sp.]|jgi:hypothetical protein|nr:hypothetical protein [Candidatus Paceibacter sp.]